MFLDGAGGWASQTLRCEEYLVSLVLTRESREHDFIAEYIHDGIEGSFPSLEELNSAIRTHNELETLSDAKSE